MLLTGVGNGLITVKILKGLLSGGTHVVTSPLLIAATQHDSASCHGSEEFSWPFEGWISSIADSRSLVDCEYRHHSQEPLQQVQVHAFPFALVNNQLSAFVK